MKTTTLIRLVASALAAAALGTSFLAMAQTPPPLLFKIITTRDEVIVAVPPNETGGPSPEVGAIGQALAVKGALTLWQYATHKGADGALVMAPRARISVLAHDSLRVEPYTPAVRVLPLQ